MMILSKIYYFMAFAIIGFLLLTIIFVFDEDISEYTGQWVWILTECGIAMIVGGCVGLIINIYIH